jgi:hypothetical protein
MGIDIQCVRSFASNSFRRSKTLTFGIGIGIAIAIGSRYRPFSFRCPIAMAIAIPIPTIAFQAALSGSQSKAPGFAGGYLIPDSCSLESE